MRAALPGWPATELRLAPPEGRVVALPLTAYPASLQDDIASFLSWITRSLEDELDGSAVGRPPSAPRRS